MNFLRHMGITILVLVGIQARADNLHCMGKILEHVLSDFGRLRAGSGVEVRDAQNNYQATNIGTNLNEDSIEIRDIHKNGYEVSINMFAIDDIVTPAFLRTTVTIENYDACDFDPREKIIYTMFRRQ